MRGESPCAVCCCSLCQHPECWRASLQQVREAVWRRNGVQPPESSRSSVDIDSLYLRRNHSEENEGLPSLKVVDMFSDMGGSIANTPRKPQQGLHLRSSSLPLLPSNTVSPANIPSATKTPQHSPAVSSPPLTEYQRRMRWKQQISAPSRLDTATTDDNGKSVQLATIGIHELYEPDEMDQEWQEVYVTSAYLVWCPSNKKRRKAKRRTSRSSSASSNRSQPKKVLPKDVTEDLVPAALETFRPPRPKSTKTPTGGQPFSPHRPPQQNIAPYGMEDPDRLPKPVLSGIMKRITWSSNQASPVEDKPDNIKDTEKEETLEETLAQEQSSSKVHLAVDINSRFTTPEEDEQMEKQKNETKQETSTIDHIKTTIQSATETNDFKTFRREPLSMHSVGLPIGDLPELEYHHCTSSIPKRLNLGIALEPVDLVPITPALPTTPKKTSQDEIASAPGPVETSKPCDQTSLVVNIPSGRPESAPPVPDLDKMYYYDSYYINNAFRYTPSPVRAPAPTPISPDKYAEFSRFSRSSRRRSSSHDDQPFKSMRRWNTLSSVYDAEYNQHTGQDIMLSDKKHDIIERQGVFLTEGVEMDNMAPPTTPRGRSPSPGSRTCIPKDIIEQFQGDIYGRKMNAAKTDDKITSKVLSNVSTGIVPPGWRPPRSRTPIQLAETPARYPPRPLRQPPVESIPKSLQIVSIRKPSELVRCKSTPPRTSTPQHELLPLVLSDTSLPANTTISMEVKGPSSVVADPGAVPPPPSPEATLKNDLQPTLETLCEEDERSSLNTSIADVVEKDVPLSRLSPLCGGSEMSDESVELPVELTENEEGMTEQMTLETTTQQQSEEITTQLGSGETSSQQGDKETSIQQGDKETSPQQVIKENPAQNAIEAKEEQSVLVDKEQTMEETQLTNDSIKDDPSAEVKDTADEQQLQKASELDQLEKFTGELFSLDVTKSSSVEPGVQEDTTSSDLQPPRGTPEPTEDRLPQRQNSAEEPPDQPPGSPDISPTQDFTVGLDMGLDLAAELQAAMEGLDDFDIDDDDDNKDDDDVNADDSVDGT